MQVLLFRVRPVPASKCVPAIPGTQFSFVPCESSAQVLCFQEIILRWFHQWYKYPAGHRREQPSGTDLCLRKITDVYMPEQTRENQKHFLLRALMPARECCYRSQKLWLRVSVIQACK